MGRKPGIETKDLVAIARRVFLEKGGFATTRDVARAAGISEAAVFKRFPTKAALYLAAMLPEDRDPSDIIDRTTADPCHALENTARNLLAYFREVIPPALHLATHPTASLADVAAHFSPERTRKLADALTAYFADAKRNGTMNPENPFASAQLLIAAIHSLATYEVLGLHGGDDMNHAIKPFIDQLWHGLSPAKSHPEGE